VLNDTHFLKPRRRAMRSREEFEKALAYAERLRSMRSNFFIFNASFDVSAKTSYV
jgi:hypothetical protein